MARQRWIGASLAAVAMAGVGLSAVPQAAAQAAPTCRNYGCDGKQVWQTNCANDSYYQGKPQYQNFTLEPGKVVQLRNPFANVCRSQWTELRVISWPSRNGHLDCGRDKLWNDDSGRWYFKDAKCGWNIRARRIDARHRPVLIVANVTYDWVKSTKLSPMIGTHSAKGCHYGQVTWKTFQGKERAVDFPGGNTGAPSFERWCR